MENQASDASILPRPLFMTYHLDQEHPMSAEDVVDKSVATFLVLTRDSKAHLVHQHQRIFCHPVQLVIARYLVVQARPPLLFQSTQNVFANLVQILRYRILRALQQLLPTPCRKESTHLACTASKIVLNSRAVDHHRR